MRMRGTFRFAGQGEPMQRPSLPVPVNGGSPSLWRIHVAVSSSSPTGGGDGLPWVAKPELVLLLTDLLAIALASKRLFHALLFTRFQIKRVTLDFLDNVFRLRRFKRKVQTEDIIKEVNRHSFYLKPGEKKRVKESLARKRNRKKVRKEQD